MENHIGELKSEDVVLNQAVQVSPNQLDSVFKKELCLIHDQCMDDVANLCAFM